MSTFDNITYSKLFTPLPPELGGSTNPQDDCKIEKVVDFLKEHVPPSDQKEIEDVLKRNLPLSKQNKRKPKEKKKRKGKNLTAREKRDLNLYKVKKDSLKFESFKKLHYLWKDYMREIIDFNNLKSVECNHPLQEFGGRIKAILDDSLQGKNDFMPS